MARLGIDYGTTNTVVVCADRGRYPLVPHVTDTSIGRVARDIFPSMVVFDTVTGSLRAVNRRQSRQKPDRAPYS